MNQGEIYKITCPLGKVYVGQTVCYLSNGKKFGTMARWTSHKTDSRRQNGGNCRRLNKAIKQFGEENFIIERLLVIHVSLLDRYEEMIISLLETTDPKHGYNIRFGGNHSRLSEETRKLMRISRRNHIVPPHTDVTKKRISQTILNNVVRNGHNGNVLPKYVKFIDWKDRQGYAIVSHPNCKIRYFVSTKKDIDALYNECIACLETLLA